MLLQKLLSNHINKKRPYTNNIHKHVHVYLVQGFPTFFDPRPPCLDNEHSATPAPRTNRYHDHDDHILRF